MWIGCGTMIKYGSIPVPFSSKCFHHQFYQATLGKEGAIHHQYTIVRALTIDVDLVGKLSPGRAFNLPRHSVRATSCSAGTVLTNSFLVSKAGTADTLRRELDLVTSITEKRRLRRALPPLSFVLPSCIQEDEVVDVVEEVRHGAETSHSSDLNPRESLRGSHFGETMCK